MMSTTLLGELLVLAVSCCRAAGKLGVLVVTRGSTATQTCHGLRHTTTQDPSTTRKLVRSTLETLASKMVNNDERAAQTR